MRELLSWPGFWQIHGRQDMTGGDSGIPILAPGIMAREVRRTPRFVGRCRVELAQGVAWKPLEMTTNATPVRDVSSPKQIGKVFSTA